MTSVASKIRVLLIDDDPSFLEQEPMIEGKRHFVPCIYDQGSEDCGRPDLAELFDLRWLASAREAREFRDLSMAIAARSAVQLGIEGWVPEIVCFDYALTKDTRTVSERGYPAEVIGNLSPLLRLRSCAKAMELVMPAPAPVPDTGGAKGADNHGCFSGGMIFSLFSDHPCAPVALTRKGADKTVGQEAAFFEWMLEQESHQTFQRKGRPAPTWNDLLFDGVVALRTRLAQLARSGIVQIALDDLLELASQGDYPHLTIRSRYGRRSLPVQGLFVDHAPGKPRNQQAAAWAQGLLKEATAQLGSDTHREGAFAGTVDDLARGRELTRKLWDAYNDRELMEKRRALSLVVRDLKSQQRALGSLSGEEKATVAAFGVDLTKELAGRGRTECERQWMDIRHPDYSPRQKRWAALMLTLQVVQRRWAASKAWAALARQHGWRGTAEVLLRAADRDDVYMALFPLPKGPVVLPWDAGKLPEECWQTLKELKSDGPVSARESGKGASTGTRWGNLGLSVPDVLQGLGWTDDPVSPSGDGAHGFLPGERLVMQWYAEALYGSDDWQSDRQMKQILNPGSEQAEGGAA